MAADAVLLDTNVLLTATSPARPLHRKALAVLQAWPLRNISLCVSGQILREYLVVSTRPVDVNGLGLGLEAGLENVAELQSRLRILDEPAAVFAQLQTLVRRHECSGKQIHDAGIVATAVVNGVNRILTGNASDFRRYAAHVEILNLAEI